MIDTEYIDGVAYHATPVYLYDENDEIAMDFDDEPIIERMELILCPDSGEPIPKCFCICAAYSDSECICGAWSGQYD